MSASWQTYKGAGNDAFRASQLQTAIEQYTLALKEDDVPQAERATILANRAQCYLKLGENGPAVDDCTACLTLSPGNLKALFRRGAALEAMNDMKGALEDYKAVVDLNPGVADAAAGLKRCQAALGIVPSQSGAVTKSRSGGSGSGSGKLGEEDAKMLEEAEGRVKEVARQKQKAQEQERTAKAEKRRAELTLNQLQSLAEDRTMYKGVGKVFVKAPKADIVSQLSTTSSKADQKLKVCQSTLDYLSKQEKEADDQFVEILGTIRRKMGVKA